MTVMQSRHWYRVQNLKPKLYSHLQVHRHDYRGLIWYMVEDAVSGRNHRFNPQAYQFIGLLNGQSTVEQIYDLLCKQLGEFAPSQDDIIEILGQLHAAELIQSDVLINSEEMFERQARSNRAKAYQRLMNPVSFQLPIWDPETFVSRYANKVGYLFTPFFALLWLLVVSIAVLQGITQASTLSNFFAQNSLNANNLLLLFVMYPLIKLIHELGHAFAIKHKGGEVHEMGINFMLYIPVPYVNASSAGHFRNVSDRILVSAAGILIESFIAGIGLLIFLNVEASALQSIAYNMFLIGGVSSLLFNGNPLLKYDGYYIFADLLGVPNLYQRSGQFWRYLFQRYILKIPAAVSPVTAPGERFWFAAYGFSAFLYRLGVLWVIAVLLVDKAFWPGILFTTWLLTTQMLYPLYKGMRFILSSPNLTNSRTTALRNTGTLVLLSVVVIGLVPLPSYSLVEGVVWLDDKSQIKADRDGFIDDLLLKSGQLVQAGNVVLTLKDEALGSDVRVARIELSQLEGQYRAAKESDLLKAELLKQEIAIAKANLQNLTTKMDALQVKTVKPGRLLIPDEDDLLGRYIHQGELLGYVVDEAPPIIRVAIPQDNIGQFRERITDIRVRLADLPAKEYPATIIRMTPAATVNLPSAALGTAGGGLIPVDPKDEQYLTSLNGVYLVDLQFDPGSKSVPIGIRVYARIEHGGETLSQQWYRRIRQTFLRQFNA